MGLIISVLFGKALQTIFFGRLRAIEVEVSLSLLYKYLKTSYSIKNKPQLEFI